jgi:hypothetical protein
LKGRSRPNRSVATLPQTYGRTPPIRDQIAKQKQRDSKKTAISIVDGGEVVRRLIDVSGGGQDFLSRHFAVLAHCLELVGDATRRHPTAGVRAFVLRSAQDVVDQRKSRCEPLNGDALPKLGSKP